MVRVGRRGNLVLLATVLCLLILTAIFALSYLTSSDANTSANLVRELQATALAESIAVTAEARANAGPWMKRFWLEETTAQATSPSPAGPGVTPFLAFSKTSGHFPTVGEGLDGLDWTYTGVIKDANSTTRSWRIYVEVTLAGETYSFSWDKRYDESLMGAVNRDATVMDKRLEQPGALDPTPTAGRSSTDELIDAIKTSAKEPEPGSVEAQNKETLTKLSTDQESFAGATTVATEPDSAPAAPAPAVYSGPGKKGR